METIICSLLTDVHLNTMDQCMHCVSVCVCLHVCVNVHCGMCVCVKIAACWHVCVECVFASSHTLTHLALGTSLPHSTCHLWGWNSNTQTSMEIYGGRSNI